MNQPHTILQVQDISKHYGDLEAVADLSLSVCAGEIFGLLGPNGAGKTTTIRMILDIIRPDSGRISVLGGPMNEAKKERIGYLPEERGLYEGMTLFDTLLFLSQLKGLARQEAREQAERYLREVELWEERERKIEALSRGMRQKAQFIAATMHEPDLIIVDEPFSGLDPVNTRLIKKLIQRMRERGAGIIMSTHQMHQVEEMCERIMLINHGRQVLYGSLPEIRRQYSRNAVLVDLRGDIDNVPGVRHIRQENGHYRLLLDDNTRPGDVLQALVHRRDVQVERFEQVETSLDEIFVEVVSRPIHQEETTA